MILSWHVYRILPKLLDIPPARIYQPKGLLNWVLYGQTPSQNPCPFIYRLAPFSTSTLELPALWYIRVKIGRKSRSFVQLAGSPNSLLLNSIQENTVRIFSLLPWSRPACIDCRHNRKGSTFNQPRACVATDNKGWRGRGREGKIGLWRGSCALIWFNPCHSNGMDNPVVAAICRRSMSHSF